MSTVQENWAADLEIMCLERKEFGASEQEPMYLTSWSMLL